MEYILGIILAILSGLGVLGFRVLQENKSLKERAANEKAQAAVNEWADKIKQVEEKVNEDQRDYDKAKSDFNENHPGSEPLPPGGKESS